MEASPQALPVPVPVPVPVPLPSHVDLISYAHVDLIGSALNRSVCVAAWHQQSSEEWRELPEPF